MNCASITRIYGENIPDLYFLKKMAAVLVMYGVMQIYEIFWPVLLFTRRSPLNSCQNKSAAFARVVVFSKVYDCFPYKENKVIIYATVQKFVVGNIF